jgi:integrase
MTVGDLFKEWITEHAALNLSERYATDAVRWWDREIATRSIARVRLSRLADDPALITRFQDDLTVAGLTTASRVQVLKVLRSVLRWGRRRYPRTLTVEFSGLFSLPSQQRKRLIYAADAVAVERLIEAVLVRPARDPLLPIRDAALVDGLHRRGSPIRVAAFRHLGRPLRGHG